MTRRPVLAAALFALSLGAALPAAAVTQDERNEIEAVVRDYLLREPELLVEVLAALEERRATEASASQREAIEAAGPQLTASPTGTVLGNPDGDVTLVEFFDYNCGFCKRAHADMVTLIEEDPELRVVLKESPVLGPPSQEAARVSLALREIEPERYEEFHGRLLMNDAVADEDEAVRIAGELGVEETPLREAMESPAVLSALQESARLLAALQISGTPSYVIGTELVPGAVGAPALAAKIASMRECGETSC